jgi:membrane associated rhomboid family serine protease
MGGFSQPNVPDQIWRFFTPIFIHTGFIHLGFNMLVQLRTGVIMERQMGSVNMFIVYMTCGMAGNLLASKSIVTM